MIEFYNYIYCCLTGRKEVFTYQMILNNKWDILSRNFECLEPIDEEDEVYVTVTEDTIKINEYYDSGIRFKGSNTVLFNKAHTELIKRENLINVTIEIERVYVSRIITNVVTLLNTLCSILVIGGLYRKIFRSSSYENNWNELFLVQVILIFILVIIWIVSRQKHISILKAIQRIINED